MSAASNARPAHKRFASRVCCAPWRPLFAVAMSIAVGGLLVLALGRNPFEVYGGC